MKIASEKRSTFVLDLELALIKLARVLETSPPIIHQDIWKERMEVTRSLGVLNNDSTSDKYIQPLIPSKERWYYKKIVKIYSESHRGYPWSKYNAFLTDLSELIVQYNHLGQEEYLSSPLRENSRQLPKDMKDIVITLVTTDHLLHKMAKKDGRVKRIIAEKDSRVKRINKTDDSAKKARVLDQEKQQYKSYHSFLFMKEKESEDSDIEHKLHLENLETKRLETEISLIQREVKSEEWNVESLKEQRVWCRNNCIPKTEYEQRRKMDTLQQEEYAESQEKEYKQGLEYYQEKICELRAVKISLLEKILSCQNESPNLGEQSSSEKKLLI